MRKSRERFSEDIYDKGLKREKIERYQIDEKLLSNKIIINFDVFGALIENGVFGDVDGSLGIRMQGYSKRWCDGEVGEKTNKASQLSEDPSHKSIFRLR